MKPIARLRNRCLFVVLFSLFLSLASTSVSGQTTKELFTLKVQIQDPYNQDLVVQVQIKQDEPFRVSATNGTVETTITGTLRPTDSSKYKLSLKITQFVSDRANQSDSWDLALELNKPWSGGPVSGIVYRRTITISKTEQPR